MDPEELQRRYGVTDISLLTDEQRAELAAEQTQGFTPAMPMMSADPTVDDLTGMSLDPTVDGETGMSVDTTPRPQVTTTAGQGQQRQQGTAQGIPGEVSTLNQLLGGIDLSYRLFPDQPGSGPDPRLAAQSAALAQDLGGTYDAIGQAVGLEQQAVAAQAQAQAQAEEQTAQRLQQLIEETRSEYTRQDEERDQEHARIQTEFQRLDQAITTMASMRVNDTNFFQSRGALSQISAALVVGAGAMSSTILNALAPGSNATNTALQIIDKAIQNDIAAQEANMLNASRAVEGRGNLLQQMRATSDSMEEARQKALAALYKRAAIEVQALTANARSAEVRAVGAQAVAKLEQNYQTLMANVLGQRLEASNQALARSARGGRRLTPMQRFQMGMQFAREAGDRMGSAQAGDQPVPPIPGTRILPGHEGVWPTLSQESREKIRGVYTATEGIRQNWAILQNLFRSTDRLTIEHYDQVRSLVNNIQDSYRVAAGYGAPQKEELIRLEQMLPSNAMNMQPTELIGLVNTNRVRLQTSIEAMLRYGDIALRTYGLQRATAASRIADSQAQGYDVRETQEGQDEFGNDVPRPRRPVAQREEEPEPSEPRALTTGGATILE